MEGCFTENVPEVFSAFEHCNFGQTQLFIYATKIIFAIIESHPLLKPYFTCPRLEEKTRLPCLM